MPTPRRHGAPLTRISLVAPAFKGLNTQSETALLGQEWATIATNAIFDESGRLAARKGWLSVTSSPMSGTPEIAQIFEQLRDDGTATVISAAGSKLWSGTTAPSDITGTATVTVGNNWQFVNFGDTLLGFQQGESPITRSTSNFSDLTATSGSVPTGNCAVVHSGRVWAADSDYQTIKYSALLDAQKWATSDGAGSIDMTSVWPHGTDQIVALAMYNGLMVVFGKNKIVIFGDGAGSSLGINPNNIYVVDTIVGVGCISRDSVQHIEGGDILFLSAQGVQSLSRVIQEKSNPLHNVSANVRDYLNSLVRTLDASEIRSVYSPEEAIYLLSIPGVVAFCFDTSGRLEDGTFRVTEWSLSPTAMHRTIAGTLYMAIEDTGGEIGEYSGYQDDGDSYSFEYASGWLDLGEDYAQFLKILKNVSGLFYVSAAVTVAIKWDFDFQDQFESRPVSLTAPGGSAEYGIAEYSEAEYAGGTALRNLGVTATGSGQYIRIGAQSTVDGASVAVQQLNMFTKIGRLVK